MRRFVLPTLTVLKRKLMKVTVKHTKSLRNCLIQGIDTRFGSLFSDTDFLLAAVTQPKFKLAWIEDVALRAQCTQILEQAVSTFISDDPLSNPHRTTEKSDDDSDFSASKVMLLLNIHRTISTIRMIITRNCQCWKIIPL